ncbi:MAG TPA: hypothetical protein VH814_18270 [Steroidobacteraceae bacterium]|jgi:hypothetical protein
MASAKEDVEVLMNALLPFAEKMLAKRGAFYPFGGAMTPDGEIVNIAGYDGWERPSSASLIELLNEAFREDAALGKYKATAVVYDVRVTIPDTTIKSDAIAVALDHRDDYSVIVLFPYSIEKGEVRIREPYAEKGSHRVFKPPSH